MHDISQGMLRGEELSAAYASADIFMMPSETETLGFVALEAMASGLPVIAVAAGGLVDIITKPGVIGESSSLPPYCHVSFIISIGQGSVFSVRRRLLEKCSPSLPS